MTPAELLALANRLLYGCRDPVTGERLSAGLPAEAIVEDVEEAARYLRVVLALLDEVERLRADAARLDHIEKHARYDPKIDGNHAWWPTTFENVLRGPTLRAAIDAAMKEAK